jgi:FkbM family methyltransferase
MNVSQKMGELTSLLPHRKVTVPFRGDRRIWLSVYADSELGYALNIYEPDIVDAFETLLDDETTVVDVGGHVGIYTLIALAEGCEVHTFEPHPSNAERIEQHAEMNGYENELNLIPAAVSDEVAEAELAVNDSATRHTLKAANPGNGTIDVSTTTLNSYFEEREVSPDVIKVDVEGAAADVLSGAARVLRSADATWIIETHNQQERDAIRSEFGGDEYVVSKLESEHFLVSPA